LSSVASIANIPRTEDQRLVWSFAHASHHYDIIRVIYQITKIALPVYILDPFDINNASVWNDQHQAMHNDMDQLLGISPFNLDDVDWKDEKTLASWIFNNFSEHYQAANILEIG
jgi:hypothetical protein